MDIIWLTLIKGKQVCDPCTNWLMSSNEWVYILGIFYEDELHVSKECGSLTKNNRDHTKRCRTIKRDATLALRQKIKSAH
jgi:hypothetical protein